MEIEFWGGLLVQIGVIWVPFPGWCQDSVEYPASRVLAASALPGSLCRWRRNPGGLGLRHGRG